MERFNAGVIIRISFSAERMFDAFRAQIIFKNIASILAPQIAVKYHASGIFDIQTCVLNSICDEFGIGFHVNIRNIRHQFKLQGTPENSSSF